MQTVFKFFYLSTRRSRTFKEVYSAKLSGQSAHSIATCICGLRPALIHLRTVMNQSHHPPTDRSLVVLCADLEHEKSLSFPRDSKSLVTFIEQRLGGSAAILRKLIEGGDGDGEELEEGQPIKDSHLTRQFLTQFNADIVAKISQSAQAVDAEFPQLKLPIMVSGQSGFVSLTRRQVLCLLSRMFLCLTPLDQAVGMKTDETPLGVRLDFSVWLKGPTVDVLRPDDPRLAYMFTLLHYFSKAVQMSESEAAEILRFGRVCLTDQLDWDQSDIEIRIANIVDSVSMDSRIGEHPGHEVEVDFANRNIGFHRTATQEEILFGLSPEMCVATLISDTLDSNEAFYITNAWKISTSKGYGTSLTASVWDGTVGPFERWVTCIDAVDLWEVVAYEKNPFTQLDLVKYQMETSQILRGLEKLRAGFMECPAGVPIATGKWGCGAFAGHPLVMMVLQVMAAAQEGQTLKLCIFGDEILQKALGEVFEMIDGKTVGEVYEMLVWKESVVATKRSGGKSRSSEELTVLQNYILNYVL